jgi:hypothetical protein
MNQYGRRYKREEPAPMSVYDATPENRIASALERIADCFEELLELAKQERLRNGGGR